ncbi:MAG: methylmalonyl-CoA epimerase [Actinobacteria bacterium]|nr:methylmalonyl-CoA epimerase [Actinomycetota bacterium]MDQ3533252.1 methylmalonyl-CoA epimerase [Actinomycetota bacterium]
MLEGIDHVALAVSDLDESLAHLNEVWGLDEATRERVEEQGVEEAMLALGDCCLQLVAPAGKDSRLMRYIERRGEGIHHIAFRVEDLEATLKHLKDKGVELIDDSPRPGGGGSLIAFVHPRSQNGVLIELIQRPR